MFSIAGDIKAGERPAYREARGKIYRRLQLTFQRNGWLLADQVLVSGFNFLTSALLARMLGVHNYGVFSVFYIVLQYTNSIQVATIVSPMLSLTPQMVDERKQSSFLRGIAGTQYAFALGCALVFCLVAALEPLHWLGLRFDRSIAVPFALTIVFFQLQDWLRRRFYLDSLGKSVFWNDVISYPGQVLVLVLLWKFATLNVSRAYYVVAMTSLIAFAVGAFFTNVRTTVRDVVDAAPATWKFGRSLLMASQFQWLGSQGILLIVAAMIGVNSASGMRAVITLLGPVNVLYQLLDNIIPVRAAHIYTRQGRPGLLAYLRKVAIALTVVIGVPILMIAIFARPIMMLAFGRPFGAYAGLVLWQCVYTMLALAYRGLQYYHRTIGTTAVLAKTAFIVAGISVGSCLVLARLYGATGAMIALVIGQAFNVAIPLRYTITGGAKGQA